MAEIINKQYASDGIFAELIEDLTNCWQWHKIDTAPGCYDETKTATRFWANEDTHLDVECSTKDHAVFFVRHKNMHVWQSSSKSIGTDNSTTIQLIKAKSAVVVKVTPMETLDLTSQHDCIIIGYERDVLTGNVRPTLSTVTHDFHRFDDASSSTTYKTYICADRSSDTAINRTSWAASLSQSNCTRLRPFYLAEIPVILNDVYLFQTVQYAGFYTGDCTINGRKYYAVDFICVLDE